MIIGTAASSVSFEGLENRQLMSGVGFSNGVVAINGSNTGDAVHVALSKDGKTLSTTLNNKTTTYKAASVYRIDVNTGSGADTILSDANVTIPLMIDSGDGNDTVTTGAGNDVIRTHGGNDVVNSGAGNDFVEGGAGNDVLNIEAGNDYADGGDGNDTISTGSGTDKVLSGAGTNIISAKNADTILGTGKNSVTRNLGAPTKSTQSTGTTTTTTKSSSSSSSSTVTPAPTPIPTPVPTPVPTPTQGSTPAQTGAPQIKINSIQTTIVAGQAYHGEATQTIVPSYQVEDATFSWDFGDPTGRFNALPGFNAAHVYETPGSYTATLTVTSPSGQSSTQSVSINVVASNYKTIYVAASGSDSSNGLSTGSAVKTLAKAMSLAGDNTQILLNRGDTFQVTTGITIGSNNVVVGTYGSGTSPSILYTGPRSGNPGLITVASSAKNVAIKGLTFNSIYSGDSNDTGMPHAIVNGGTNVTIRDNTFLNVAYAVNNNGLPTGVLIMDNKAPLATGIRDYFVWCQGTDLVIVGNSCANSTRQHIVRSGGTDRFNISYNNFTNLDRTNQGDVSDTAKGTLVIQKGSFAYVAYNQVHGPVGVGPLGLADGLNNKGARFVHAAFEGNTLFGNTLDVHHGAENITIRGNTIYVNDLATIKVEPYNTTYGRGVSDLVIDHNVGINTGTTGNFLLEQGPTDGITLTNNVYVAPNLVAGSYQTAAVYVNENNLNSFRRIDGNVWPSVSRALGYARGGEMVVGTAYSTAAHKTPAEWNAFSVVGDDQFTDVTLDNVASYAMKITSVATQSKLLKAA